MTIYTHTVNGDTALCGKSCTMPFVAYDGDYDYESENDADVEHKEGS